VERLALYDEGLAEGGHDAAACERLRRAAAVWRYVYVADSQAQAEDELAMAILHTRQHQRHARATYNPPGFATDPALLNPFNDPQVPDAEAVTFALAGGALYGTPVRVAEQVAALRAAGVHHVLCQMVLGDLAHDKVMASMRRFAEGVMPRFPGD
jgi:alkanesulfonate monooxygenase SsuD/methylene tetrahydromethanopterin reductase-like flavin-dependent oxidoreductase (luciferase family)